jgi:hypothetical protein
LQALSRFAFDELQDAGIRGLALRFRRSVEQHLMLALW